MESPGSGTHPILILLWVSPQTLSPWFGYMTQFLVRIPKKAGAKNSVSKRGHSKLYKIGSASIISILMASKRSSETGRSLGRIYGSFLGQEIDSADPFQQNASPEAVFNLQKRVRGIEFLTKKIP